MANITRKCCSLNMALALNILQCDTFTRIEPKIVSQESCIHIFAAEVFVYHLDKKKYLIAKM